MCLYATIYLALMGREGLKEVNRISCDGAHYLQHRLMETGKFTPAFDKPFLKEFAMRTDLDVDALNRRLEEKGMMGPLKAGDGIVTFAVTEKRTKEEIDNLIKVIEED